MDIRNTQLHPNQYFHVFNRGVNGMAVFFEEANYRYFLKQLAKYVLPFVHVYAYCLIKNHFHLLLQVKEEQELEQAIKQHSEKPFYWHVSNSFSSFLQGYTRAINKAYDRTGPLFEPRFRRIIVDNDAYFSQLIMYIHHNPVKHQVIDDFALYPYSSYQSHISTAPTKLARDEVISWFGGCEQFIDFHQQGQINLRNDLRLEE